MGAAERTLTRQGARFMWELARDFVEDCALRARIAALRKVLWMATVMGISSRRQRSKFAVSGRFNEPNFSFHSSAKMTWRLKSKDDMVN